MPANPPGQLQILFSHCQNVRIACYIGCQKGTAIKIAVPSIFSYILMILTYNALILSNAATEFSYVPNAVSLKYPSPLGPNPDPGVPTTLAFSKR